MKDKLLSYGALTRDRPSGAFAFARKGAKVVVSVAATSGRGARQ